MKNKNDFRINMKEAIRLYTIQNAIGGNMSRNHEAQVSILSVETINNDVTVRFSYNQLNYCIMLSSASVTDREKIDLLNVFYHNRDHKVPNPLKVSANDKYLIIKVRYKLNGIPENFCFTATKDSSNDSEPPA
jgi:hypothetical protein